MFYNFKDLCFTQLNELLPSLQTVETLFSSVTRKAKLRAEMSKLTPTLNTLKIHSKNLTTGFQL